MEAGIRLTDEFVQAVRDVVDITDIAGDVTSLTERGGRWVGLCPFHQEKTPSFSVDSERGLYYCFGCGAGGDAIRFWMETSGDDFTSAMVALARRYGVPLPRGGEVDRQQIAVESALQAAVELFSRERRRSDFANRYLERRRVPEELIERYEIGFAPDDWRILTDALEGEFGLPALEAAGLVGRSKKSGRPYDRFRNRLMFPIHSPSGRLVGFGGRTLGDDRAKYINSAETPAFQKKHLLYGLHHARRAARESRRLILVEGYFDVIGAVASGAEEAVASMGTSLTREQVALLERYADEVVVGYDGDRAGEEACRKALPLMLRAGLGVKRARFPAGQDPDSLRLEEGPEAVREVIETARDAVELEIERVPVRVRNDPSQQRRAASHLQELLSSVRDPLLRGRYVRQAAERIGVNESDLLVSRGGGRLSGGAGSVQRTVRETVVTIEEGILEQLLAAQEQDQAPALESLPGSDVFLQDDCREIYRVYRQAREQDRDPIEALRELSKPSSEGPATGPVLDVVPRLLLQTRAVFSESKLLGDLRRLFERWCHRRQQELRISMQEAQRRGDLAEVGRLAAELQDLSRQRHGAGANTNQESP